MTDMHWVLMAGSLALAICLAAWFGRKRASRRDMRLMLGTGACLGGASLLLAELVG